MAITYRFSCPACDAKEKIYVGTTRADCNAGNPDYELAVCYDCKKLMHTTNKCCYYCGVEERNKNDVNTEDHFSETFFSKIAKLFRKKKIPQQKPLSTKGFTIIDTCLDGHKRIPCPKCLHEYLISSIALFHD